MSYPEWYQRIGVLLEEILVELKMMNNHTETALQEKCLTATKLANFPREMAEKREEIRRKIHDTVFGNLKF